MEIAGTITTDKLLERGLDELHYQTSVWLNEIDFWKVELHFFEKLLEKNALKNLSHDEKAKLESIQNRIIYYKGELLEQYMHDIREHAKELKKILDGDQTDDQHYRKQHKKYADQLAQFVKVFKTFKKDLFGFVISLE